MRGRNLTRWWRRWRAEMATLIFHGQFHDGDGLGLAGLTVTCDVYRTALADGTTSQVVTAGSASETGGGIYRYLLASADPSTYHYVANLKTTDTDAAQRHVAALGLVVPDAQVSAVPAGVWDAARSGHAGAGTFGATDEWTGSVDEAAIAAAVLAALEGSPITVICINPERSEDSDYDILRNNASNC